jgi:rhamnosyltransferase
METSIIIRTKNEEKWIGKVLERFSEQTYTDFEIVIVDSGSTDKTLEIANRFPTKIFHIKPEEFSYPYALNFGCEHAQGSKYFVFLSAHSLPLTKTWLADGLKNFANEKVMGVYGMMQALPDGTIWEKIYFNRYKVFLYRLFHWKKIIREGKMGVLGFTHAIIRRDLWEQNKLDERYGIGGEEAPWIEYWFKRGFVIVKDSRFSVAHSHGLNWCDLQKQWKHWRSVAEPQSFEKLDYKK